MPPDALPALDELRARLRRLERSSVVDAGVLPFGVDAIDAALPGGGLGRGTLHEVAGGGPDEVFGAAAALFLAGILARLGGQALWCAARGDLFPPGLAMAGLSPATLLHARAPDEAGVLLAMEEALRHPALAAVVGEVTRLPMVASRRLVLAAEKTGVMALALRRRREGAAAKDAPNAAATRWRVTPLPSAPLASPGIGRARWTLALTRCRGGEAAEWIVEACDAQGRLSLPADLAHRSVGVAA